MPAARDAARHAGTLYRRGFGRVRRPVRAVEAEVEHLREIEREGESAETPFVAILGIVLFLLPIVAIVLGLAFAAYYLAS
jgi:nitrogen fixation/metabolism regulation signal transduction histidine kinase